MSPLLLPEILFVFLDTLTADAKYRVEDCGILLLPIQMQLSEKRKIFFHFFFFHYWNLHQILNILKKKDNDHSFCSISGNYI